jgi:hypothetical protein
MRINGGWKCFLSTLVSVGSPFAALIKKWKRCCKRRILAPEVKDLSLAGFMVG